MPSELSSTTVVEEGVLVTLLLNTVPAGLPPTTAMVSGKALPVPSTPPSVMSTGMARIGTGVAGDTPGHVENGAGAIAALGMRCVLPVYAVIAHPHRP